MKSRRAKIVLVAIGGVVVVLMVCAGWRDVRQGGFKPSASLRLVGYSKDANGNIIATIGVTNSGSSSFAICNHPHVSVSAGGAEGLLTADWHFYRVPIVLSRCSSYSIDLVLPPDCESWHCAFEIYAPTARAKAINWLIGRVPAPIWHWLTQYLPNKLDRGTQLLSPTFQVPTELASP